MRVATDCKRTISPCKGSALPTLITQWIVEKVFNLSCHLDLGIISYWVDSECSLLVWRRMMLSPTSAYVNLLHPLLWNISSCLILVTVALVWSLGMT